MRNDAPFPDGAEVVETDVYQVAGLPGWWWHATVKAPDGKISAWCPDRCNNYTTKAGAQAAANRWAASPNPRRMMRLCTKGMRRKAAQPDPPPDEDHPRIIGTIKP